MIRFRSIIASAVLLSPLLAEAGSVDYPRDVKPVLRAHCYECHGPSKQKGGLRLDTATFALRGGDSGPAIVPGRSGESLLLQAVLGAAKDLDRMPLKAAALAEADISLLKNWIDQGAKAPENELAAQPASQTRHWSFIPPRRPAWPQVKNPAWPRNAIDRFILARLEKEKIAPSPEADRITLIRRLSLDLIGLPPAPEQVDAFRNDTRPDAYEHLVERLLNSPHYGERWGRHWLDVARYADSNGYSIDAPRSIWKYRDWVIDALNRDMPFDQFVIEQLAGDLLPGATLEQRIATGFHRNTQINQEGGIDPEQFRIEAVLDRVNTTGTAFLGLTIACAQCHSHKFDPISQREYFELFAFFNSSDEPTLEIASPEQLRQRDGLRRQIKKLQDGLKEYDATLSERQKEWEKSLTPDQIEALDEGIASLLKIEPEQRSRQQQERLEKSFRGRDRARREMARQLDQLQKREPRFVTTMVVAERDQPRDSFVFVKGDFTRRGDPVTAGVPAVLHPLTAENPTRLDLAEWLVDSRSPLTARVMANRIWQRYFGLGLVETENDFGTQGTPPTHPELLDWLATELMDRNWSLKAIHRLIVTSATYRQASRARPELAIVDPRNRLLARQSRLRLDAEIVRDAALSSSGMIEPIIGGPGVFPPQPDGVMTLGQSRREWKMDTGADRYRRGIYTFFWRATPHPALAVFDAPDSFSTCTRRVRSNTPLQALTLLNDKAFFELAKNLARRIVRSGPGDHGDRIDYAFRLCLGRAPDEPEKSRLSRLLTEELEASGAASGSRQGRKPGAAGEEPDELSAWTTVARVLLNLDETITRE